MASRSLMGVIVFLVISAAATAEPNDWAHYGHTAARHSIAVDGPNTIDSGTLAWNAWEDPCYPGYYVEFEGATGPVVYDGKVYGYAKFYEPNEFGPGGFDYVASQVISFDANSGAALWATVIDQAIWDSWSSPCVDAKHDTVLIGSGTKLYALDADAGGVIWSTQLEKMTINASVCVALDIPFARAFITDYDGFGDTGKLYCVNLDPNVASNLYEPGEIVWSDGIGGSSGNSPAYADGVVYVGSVSEPPGSVVSGGTIHAYDATSSTVSKLWEATDPNFEGFFGGLVVTKAGYIYAANYDFFGNEDNSVGTLVVGGWSNLSNVDAGYFRNSAGNPVDGPRQFDRFGYGPAVGIETNSWFPIELPGDTIYTATGATGAGSGLATGSGLGLGFFGFTRLTGFLHPISSTRARTPIACFMEILLPRNAILSVR